MGDRTSSRTVIVDSDMTTVPSSGEGSSESPTDKAKGAASKAQSTAQGATETAKAKAGQAKEQATAVAGQATEQAGEKVDVGMDKAAGGLGKLADTVRQQAEGGGPVPGQATMVAEKLDMAANYLRDKDSDQLIGDLEGLVRRKPVESLVAAVGVGFLLSKALR